MTRFLPPIVDKNLIQDGDFIFLFQSHERWGVFKITVADIYADDSMEVDTDYHAPGYHTHEELIFHEGYRWFVAVHGLRAIVKTEEEADQIADQMLALLEIYKEETRGPLLKLQMGVGVMIASR